MLYFAGAAKKAGMAYRGCMLLTPDGRVPGRSMLPVISEALARAGLQLPLVVEVRPFRGRRASIRFVFHGVLLCFTYFCLVHFDF